MLGCLHAGAGAKFVTLRNRTGAARAPLIATLDHLMALGLVVRNTGHGHPMRPEYVLTEAGRTVGEPCVALATLIDGLGERDLAYRKWTLPIIAAIGERRRRFRDLRLTLAVASPRALTLGLKQLRDHRWIGRTLIDEYPPSAGYHLLGAGERVYARLGGLC